MVPRKLRLRNFMAYRAMEQPIDFTGIHVACLTGVNGAGKSTLLDAMTWAVWGQSRAKSDDDLVALGENEMEVEFEFALAEELYRVLRKRSKPGVRRAGHSMLELFVAAGEDGDTPNFVPITGNTLRETEAKLRGLLRLDYDTFVNSALLLQGRADEFTTKRADQRKQVLADVLGLGRYDRYAEAAREQARQRDANQTAAVREIVSLEQQLSQRPEYQAELNAAQSARAAVDALVGAHEQAVLTLAEAQRLRQERSALALAAQDRVRRAEADLQELHGQRAVLTKRMQEASGLLSQREVLLAALQEYGEARTQEELLAVAAQRVLKLRTDQARLESAVERARADLTKQEALLVREVSQYQALAAERPTLERAAGQAAERLGAVAPQEAALAALRGKLAEAAQQVGSIQQSLEETKRQGTELRDRRDQLKESGAQGACPLCGSELGDHGVDRIVAEYGVELKRLGDLYRQRERLVAEAQAAQQAAQGEAGSLDAWITKERAEAQTLHTTATNRLKDVEAAEPKLLEAGARLTTLQSQIATGAFAAETADALTEARQAIADLGYDEADHRAVRERLRSLEGPVALAQRLPEAERAAAEAQQDIERVALALQRREAELADDQAGLERLQTDLIAAPDVAIKLATAQRELEDARRRANDLTGTIGRLQGDLERCDRLQVLLDERRGLAKTWLTEKALYDELTLAFGRRGIQALLIETALPELEDETNALLGRMTDNRLTVKLETQRQARTSGATIETLDIRISDELGTRPYELYSGGEAFRINFALRIALSKLLARRAGAPLPTLIIDEGFGTQDVAGREKLVEAVNAVAEEFQCVLVITHVEELKDVFPARIEVTKGFNGSTAVVVRA